MRATLRLLLLLVSSLALCVPEAPPALAAPPGGQVLVLLRLAPEHFRLGLDYGAGYGDGPQRGANRRIAGALARAHGLSLASDWPLPLAGLDCFVMNVPAGRSPEAEASALSRDRQVAWAEPMRLYHGQGYPSRSPRAPDDPLFPVQPAAREWRLADLWQIADGRGVRIAVIDSAIERSHPDLAGQIAVSEDFTSQSPAHAGPTASGEAHGTGVAGVIAARVNNALGMAGVAPGARLLALRACWQPAGGQGAPPISDCDTLSLAKALHFALVHDADVINLSLAGPDDPLLGRLIDLALARGVTVVGAADPALPSGGFPASHAGVVAVTGEIPGAARRIASSRTVAAPGLDVPTTQPGGRWYLVDGSSYAAAHVSGLFALLRQHNRRAADATALVRRGSDGEIDACASLLRVAGPCDCACAHGAGAPPAPGSAAAQR